MSEQTDNLVNLLTPFGLSQDEARVYLILLESGELTALSISRKIQLGRTKVYRLLDKLIAKELVVNQFDAAGFKFRAEAPEKLALLLSLKQAQLTGLEQNLPRVQQALLTRMGAGREGSRVLYYQGKRGVAQVNWHMTQAQGELLSLELATANAFMEQEEAEALREELVANKITTRTITNAVRLEPFTQVTDLVRDFWEIRHLPASWFEIRAEMFIYNDVYCLYHYTSRDVFAVEIYNRDLAAMQRQVFDFLWEEAEPMEKVGDQGEVRVGDAKLG